jgi:SNF2 family DNA or RNA helicase
MELLGEALEGNHRVLVFSQFTALLDLVEPLLQSREVGFLRLDGSTRDRAAVVDNFQAPNGPPVFLLSLKAGGAGLNLTAADTVIHLDPWWNPAVEAQAIDRAHRFGQTRCVTSIKLIARSTVEEKVLRLQAEKRELFASAIDAEAAWEGLNEREMADLLRD